MFNPFLRAQEHALETIYIPKKLKDIMLGKKSKKKKVVKNYWTYQLMAHEYKGEVWLEMHEVFYMQGKPNSYSHDGIVVHGDNLRSVKWNLNKMIKAIKKPILWAGDKWPQVYEK